MSDRAGEADVPNAAPARLLLRHSDFRMSAEDKQRLLEAIGFAGMTGIEHSPDFALVNAKTARKLDSRNAHIPHFQIEGRLQGGLNRHGNHLLSTPRR